MERYSSGIAEQKKEVGEGGPSSDDADAPALRGDRPATPDLGEQLKRFPFVFLLGILGCITTQVNTLTQMIHGRQMFFPIVVQNAQ